MRECHILEFCSPSDINDNTSAILEWARQGQAAGVKLVLGNDGVSGQADFILSEEIEITKPGQIIEFQQSGGYAYGKTENLRLNWDRGTRLRGVGNWFSTTGKRVRTRRLYRGSAVDPQDAPLSAMINVQAEGVTIINPALWLDCDYSDATPGNRGVDCDTGIFVGCRVGFKTVNPMLIGYFRRASLYMDVSGATALARHLSVEGDPYPDGTVKNGMDGWTVENPYILGGKVGLAVLGARPKAGQTDYSTAYYDQQLGSTVSDSRGSFGASDGLVLGGRIYGPDHHSNRRLRTPGPGILSKTTLEAEDDTMAAAVYIDGLAGNASSNIWGMRFIGTRIATFEAFRVRLRKASRVSFIGCHIEGRNDGRMKFDGTPIDTNDYTFNTYGSIAGDSTSDRLTVFGTVSQTKLDMVPHYYGPMPFLITDSGRIFAGGVYDQPTSQTSSPVVITADGQLKRSTSAAKYKTNIRPITDDIINAFMEMDGVLYDSAIPGEEDICGKIGFIADEADKKGLKSLVIYDGKTVENFDYARSVAVLLEILKRQQKQINEIMRQPA